MSNPIISKKPALKGYLIKFRPATSYSHRGKPPITIGAEELNFRVRDGNGCDLFAIVTGLCMMILIETSSFIKVFSHLQN